jgi:hypothetical protein
MSLRGFTFKTLGVALFHGHLKKIAVMLKAYWVPEYMRIEPRIDHFGGVV